MPRVEIVGSFGLVGEDRQSWLPGEVHDASEAFAKTLVRQGRAIFAEGEPPIDTDAGALTTASPINRMSRPSRTR